MPNTLEGFLVVAGLALFVFSLFNGKIKYKDATLPSLIKNGRVILMILGPALMAIGGLIYYLDRSYPMASANDEALVGIWRINANGFEGVLEISKPNNEYESKIKLHNKPWENITNFKLYGKRIEFDRNKQHYTGEINDNEINGMFNSHDGTFEWSALKM